MKKVFTTKAFLLVTLLFVFIAVSSLVAFRETEKVCTSVKKCNEKAPRQSGDEMLWDVFSRQLISIVSLN